MIINGYDDNNSGSVSNHCGLWGKKIKLISFMVIIWDNSDNSNNDSNNGMVTRIMIVLIIIVAYEVRREWNDKGNQLLMIDDYNRLYRRKGIKTSGN